jgi:hypothetical protein
MPCPPFELVLVTDGGEVVHGQGDNYRARISAEELGSRFMQAGIASRYYFRGGWSEPDDCMNLLLSMGLAEFEERFCVADWCRERLSALRGER